MSALSGLGLSTADFAPRLTELPDCLDRFASLGVDSVELSLASFEVIGGCRVWPDRLAELRRICADRSFGYTVHGPIKGNFADPRHAVLHADATRACLEVSAALGATVLVLHGAMMPHLTAAERASRLALERETLAALAPEAEAAGVVLCVETLFGRLEEWTPSPAELAAQIRGVDHPHVRACIDFSHAYLNAGERGYDATAELAELAPLTRHLHIHDSFARPRSFPQYSRDEAILYGLGDIHLPPGRGALPWAELRALNFAGPTVANLELTTRHADQLEAAVAWTRAWVAGA
jgi:sugar phosphate isomerase/epimerase